MEYSLNQKKAVYVSSYYDKLPMCKIPKPNESPSQRYPCDRRTNGRTDKRTDGQMDGRTKWFILSSRSLILPEPTIIYRLYRVVDSRQIHRQVDENRDNLTEYNLERQCLFGWLSFMTQRQKSGNWGLDEIDCHGSHKGQCNLKKSFEKQIWKKLWEKNL